jgi:hypothetical protein
MKILRTTDKVSVSAQGVTATISPLSQGQKVEIMSTIGVVAGKEQTDLTRQAHLTVKYCVKEIDGIDTFDGEKYSLTKDSNGNLTDDCAAELVSALAQTGLLEQTANIALGVLKETKGYKLKVNGKEIDLSKKS